jgi:hypothetical protein
MCLVALAPKSSHLLVDVENRPKALIVGVYVCGLHRAPDMLYVGLIPDACPPLHVALELWRHPHIVTSLVADDCLSEVLAFMKKRAP